MDKSNKSSSKLLYLIGAICGFIAVFIFRRNLSAELSLFNYFGLFSNDFSLSNISIETLHLIFTTNSLIGLIIFNFFDFINVILVFLLMLPIFLILSDKNKILSLILLLLSISTIILYFLSNNAFFFLFNYQSSDQQILSEIQSKLSNTNYSILTNTGLFFFYFYSLISAIIFSFYKIFSKFTFWFGIVANGIGLCYFILIPIIPSYAFLSIVLAAPFTVIWHMNLSMNLIKLYKEKNNT